MPNFRFIYRLKGLLGGQKPIITPPTTVSTRPIITPHLQVASIYADRVIVVPSMPDLTAKTNFLNAIIREAEINTVRDRAGHFWNWATMQYGEEPSTPHDAQYRGYVQVDYTQMAEAVFIIDQVAKIRQELGVPTKVKFLQAIVTADDFTNYAGPQHLFKFSLTGKFTKEEPDKPVIIVYGDNKEDILTLLRTLTHIPYWRSIEGERQYSDSVAGTKHIYASDGRPWLTLTYLDTPGFARGAK